ncbi:MAG: formylglycine-generating enzyme family protein [Campylobacteraceae bacterium]|jgi:formylglycine-generating enzyme required for sulfatase activity/uncharacterized pyridoxamine 5'-phosphate oxidase family protein|nr:formylglycine-generating enzyme family protein [Campylobacteraceae bacterium]
MRGFLLFTLLSFGFGADNKINSIGVELVFIPSGSFMMGCDENNGFCWEDEAPRHRVIISKPFYLGKYEVTQKQWQALMGDNPSKVKGGDLPVTNVSWNDVSVFIKKLNDKETTDRYRLPSEAEWEYAARAGTDTRYFWGNGDENTANQYAWINANSKYEIQKAGQKKPNTWGLHDMAGNVWEWVNDTYQEDYYQYNHITNPKGADEGVEKIMRGGSYEDNLNFARSAFRHSGYYDGTPSSSRENIGFRLAMSADENELETFRADFGDYYAKIYLADKNSDYSSGFTAIYEKKSSKKLISVDFEELYIANAENIAANPQKFMQYTGIIVYDDFNFDGKKDFALLRENLDYMYEIYLHTPQGFVHSQAFSDLTYSGMFNIDKKNKKLSLTEKDGCCYHAYYEFDVIDKNKLKHSKTFTEELISEPYVKYTQTIWNDNNTTLQTDWVKLDFGYSDTAKQIFSFVLEKSSKKAVVFIDGSENINYALLDKNETVEFACPAYYLHEADGECGQTENAFNFQENKGKTSLEFTNKNTLYSIYQTDDKSYFGVIIKTKEGKTYEMKGKKGSLSGDLKEAGDGKNIVCQSCG